MAVIRMTGFPGSGKSTLAERAAKLLGYDLHQIGKIFRREADILHMSIEDYYRQVDTAFEREVDRLQEELMMRNDDLVVDGRMAPWLRCGFRAVNVKVVVSQTEGALRLLRRPENRDRTVAEMITRAAERIILEREHFRSLYGIADHLDGRFDIVLDTTKWTEEETLQRFLESFRRL